MENKYSVMQEKWLSAWEDQRVYATDSDTLKPKFYCLDMFPYPSGAGLHVGHPRGYIASDIVSRFKRMQGYNVLHPMGFDSFGLPAEQYAIETGQHPAITTSNNIANFKRQLRKLGFCHAPERELLTSDPAYYRWTQWIFVQLFNSWYDFEQGQARPLSELIRRLEQEGNVNIAVMANDVPLVTARDWHGFSTLQRSELLVHYRLAYRADSTVNWCPALGTVLANDEVKDGFSERGGHPVEKKVMKQWMLRITAYADRLLDGLTDLQWPEAVKEIQRNWIGKSLGCEIDYPVLGTEYHVTVFTTRPETIYGNTFLVLAPEHPLIPVLTCEERKAEVEDYVAQTARRSERERKADVERVSGVFSGAFAGHPLTGEEIPIWIGEYVLADYGTGAIMAVPGVDERDHRFAQQFGLPRKCIVAGADPALAPHDADSAPLANSGELDGMMAGIAREHACALIERIGKGKRSIRYRLRDAIFGRQRYWGEPIPIYYDAEGVPHALKEEDLPLILPRIDEFLPTSKGEPPIARAERWTYNGDCPLETTTMPGWAGSSWYFLRYMDPENCGRLADPQALSYWNSVDLYIGGAEHATGHLLYSRFWTHFLKDLGVLTFSEPFQKLVCQGMVLGQSAIIYRDKETRALVSADLRQRYDTQPLYVDIGLVDAENRVDIAGLRSWRKDYQDAPLVLSGGQLLCERISEKMSKSKYNAIVPDDVIDVYGADCFRIHQMFLGPIDQLVTWSTQAIDGPHKFLHRIWRLFYDEHNQLLVSREVPSAEELKVIHQAVKNVSRMTESLSFNTGVAAMMTCVNQLSSLKCHKAAVLEMLLKILHPFAPFLTEELWSLAMQGQGLLLDQRYPTHDEAYLVEHDFEYPVSINGKLCARVRMGKDIVHEQASSIVLEDPAVKKKLAGAAVRKIVFVPGKIVNIVAG